MNGRCQQIIAIGGGGFSDSRDPGLDEYLLQQARVPRPTVCFVGAASGDADSYLAKFYAAFSRYECRPCHLPLFRRTPDLSAYVRAQDVIFVGGGNTRSMLAVWREWGLPELLREAYETGTVLAGISAGTICWFEQGVTDSAASEFEPLQCLGLISGSCCPHYDGESERKPAYHRLVSEKKIPPGIAIDDGVAVHFVEGRPWRVVAARPKAGAYRIELTAGAISESALQAERIQLDDRTYGSGLPDRGQSERGSPFLNDTLPRSSLIGAARKQPQGSSLGRHT